MAAELFDEITLFGACFTAAGGSVDVGFDILAEDDDALVSQHRFTLGSADRGNVSHHGHWTLSIS